MILRDIPIKALVIRRLMKPLTANKHYKFSLGSRDRFIHITSDFESGNIDVTRQFSQFHYRLACVDDAVTTRPVNSRSWFYFQVYGFPRNTRGKFAVSKVQTLVGVYHHSPPDKYRPVCRHRDNHQAEWSEWIRLPTPAALVLRENGELEVTFQWLFRSEQQQAEFAFCYPYTYTQHRNFIGSLNDFYAHEQLYFYQEVLIRSPLQNDVHLITITSAPEKSIEEQQILFNQYLFPQKRRPLAFKKPVVLITARVHPGETAASFAMEGVLNFLTNLTDLRAHLLRKMFVFMIVPMLNVDGVKLGHFRMDSFGRNLNRHYITPDREQQPAIYAVKELAIHLRDRMAFYFDLHAHNACKGAFIYGNAINDFVEQVESQVFCKAFAMNDAGFEYEHCNFSEKQMKSKDRYEDLTKEGCGRVVMHKLSKIVHSYSLECGIMSTSVGHAIPPAMNAEFEACGRGLVNSKTDEVSTDKEAHWSPATTNFLPPKSTKSTRLSATGRPAHKSCESKPIWFTPQHYRNLGKNLLVTILDVFDKNPYNRIYNSPSHSLDLLRRITAFQVFHKAERFRMFERYVYGKVKNINELIKDVLNEKLHYRQLNDCYFCDDHELRQVEWPTNINGLLKPKGTQHRKAQEEETSRFMRDLRVNKKHIEEETRIELIKNKQNYSHHSEHDSEEDNQKDNQKDIEGSPQTVQNGQECSKSQFFEQGTQKNQGNIEETQCTPKHGSSSVRVRKLIPKQERGKELLVNDLDIKSKLSRMMYSNQTSTEEIAIQSQHHFTQEIQAMLFQSIRSQLKSDLMKPADKLEGKFKGRKIQIKRDGSNRLNCRFPAINEHFVIITSSKGLK